MHTISGMLLFHLKSTVMKKILVVLSLLISLVSFSQSKSDSLSPFVRQYDTVIITPLGRQPYKNIPYNIEAVTLAGLRKTPRTQLMQQLTQLPSVSSISAGGAINKPLIRGLSFNHVQLFAQGVRIDNQTWDDRHDIGVSDNGFDKVEVINGPAALLYGPNTMGGAILLHETMPGINEKPNGFVQLGYFSNTIGGDLKAGIRGSKKELFYSANATYQMHAAYVQGEGGEKSPGAVEEDKPLAANSKYTNLALKGTIGVRKEKSTHQFTYNMYHQLLGIIEDESQDQLNNPNQTAERDYEMEAPYQDVTTHILSTQNSFIAGRNELVVNAGYQYNARKEFEPGTTPKSKFLGVGLNLQTFTADLQWIAGKNKPAGFTIGVQGFYQDNKNNGNIVLVPDAHISTIGAYFISHVNVDNWSILAGVRVDQHQLNLFTTNAAIPDTFKPAIPRPAQAIKKSYTPFSANIGLVYHATKELSFKINGATGYTAPNYAQLAAFGKHEGTYRFEVGDNNLSMEKNVEADGTIQYDNQNVSLSLNGYLNHIKDYIYINPTADSVKGLRIYRWTQHDANINGLELDFQLHPSDAKWFEGFIRAGLLRGMLTNGNGDLPYIPATKVITGLTFKKENIGKWQQSYVTLQTSIYGKQSKVAQFEEETDGYFLVDLFVGTTAPFGKQHRWNIVAFCTNLLNKGYFNHLSLIKTIDVREPGRNIGVQLRYSF
jgi:iron complex outermembrane recepter protein